MRQNLVLCCWNHHFHSRCSEANGYEAAPLPKLWFVRTKFDLTPSSFPISCRATLSPSFNHILHPSLLSSSIVSIVSHSALSTEPHPVKHAFSCHLLLGRVALSRMDLAMIQPIKMRRDGRWSREKSGACTANHSEQANIQPQSRSERGIADLSLHHDSRSSNPNYNSQYPLFVTPGGFLLHLLHSVCISHKSCVDAHFTSILSHPIPRDLQRSFPVLLYLHAHVGRTRASVAFYSFSMLMAFIIVRS